MSDGRLWVLDASSIITIANTFEVPDGMTAGTDEMDRILAGVTALAEDGRAVITPQVRDECRDRRVQDFAKHIHALSRDLQPGYEAIRTVMSQTLKPVSPDDEADVADPWVIAQALHLNNQGADVWIVTEDRKDRLPKKASLATAAHQLGLDVCRLFFFLREERLW